jgi:hypothetical protein
MEELSRNWIATSPLRDLDSPPFRFGLACERARLCVTRP